MKQVVSSKQIGKKIRELRKHSNKRAVEVAKALRISRQQLYHIEGGKRGLTLERLQLASRFFNVDPASIIGRNDRKTA